MPSVPVPVKRSSADLPLPAYQHPGDAGLDLRAREAVRLKPGERRLIPTGLRLALPAGTVGIIKDRSGLAFKLGLHTMAGVIDSNYRGEVKVLLVNLGRRACRIKAGDRIAQLIVLPCLEARLVPSEELPESERNESGFGSSGVL